MELLPGERLPEAPEWVYEVKLDRDRGQAMNGLGCFIEASIVGKALDSL